MDTYWCDNCNDYVIDRSKPWSLADAKCPYCKKKGLDLFDPKGNPLDALRFQEAMDARLKLGIPDWFDGEIYENGKRISNPRTGEEIYLNNIEASIYDVGNGAQMILKDIEAKREIGLTFLKNLTDMGFTKEQVISQQESTLENASNWLKANNVSAYKILEDVGKHDTWNQVMTQSPEKLFITQFIASRSIKALFLVPLIAIVYTLVFESQDLPLHLLSINGALLLFISTPFLLTFVFKRISIIQSVIFGLMDVFIIGYFLEGGSLWVSIILTLITLKTFMYQFDERTFLDIESNLVTQVKSRFMDCSTGTFMGVLLASIIKLIFF